jgi:hypothetical protein
MAAAANDIDMAEFQSCESESRTRREIDKVLNGEGGFPKHITMVFIFCKSPSINIGVPIFVKLN